MCAYNSKTYPEKKHKIIVCVLSWKEEQDNLMASTFNSQGHENKAIEERGKGRGERIPDSLF